MASASILLIEPDDDSRDMYAEFLWQQNFTCVTAITTDDALACSSLADAIVTGIRVEGSFDGIELVRRLRLNAATKQLPIVVLSACAFEPDQRRAFDAGCDVFLPKPCLPEHLVSELQQLLARRAMVNSPSARVSAKTRRYRRAS